MDANSLHSLLIECQSLTRKEAEAKVTALQSQDPPQFIMMLGEIMGNDKTEENVRMLAAIIFKNTITNPTYHASWHSLSNEVQAKLEAIGVALLSNASHSNRKCASFIISSIVRINLPAKKSVNLFRDLIKNSLSESVQTRVSSLTAVSIIVEESDSEPLKEFTDSLLNSAIQVITHDTSNESITWSYKILLHSLKLCSLNFQKEDECGFILNAVIKGLHSSIQEIKYSALLCVSEIISMYYSSIDKLVEPLGHLLLGISTEDLDMASTNLQIIQIWIEICSKEKELIKKKCSKGFIETGFKFMTEKLLSLLSQSIDEDADEAWNLRTACGCCLGYISQVVGNFICKTIFEFVQKGLAQEDPAIKRSALTALGSILEGPDPQMISSFLVECTENILKCAAHSDALLRECACWCVSRICETLPQFVLSNEMFERYCNCLIEQLKVTTKSANHACLSFYYLTRITHHKTTALGVSLLSQPKYFVPIIGSLWEIFFRPESISSTLNLCSSALLAIINIINFTNCNSSFIGQLIQKSLQFINETTTEAAHGKPHIEEYQAYFTSILYNCLEKAKSSVQPSDAQQILSIIFNVFRARNSTYDEGFLTISVIATLMGQEFEKYLSVLVPFIENAFSNAKDIPLIRTACLCLNETSRAVKEKMEPFLPNLIGLLVKFLSDSDADREIKILAFESIGDIALSVSAHFTNYVEPLMKVFISAADISLVPFQSDDIDEANDYEDYIDRLISSLLDCSTSMVLCMKDANSTVLIQPYIEGLVKYCIEVGKKYGNKQRDTWKERMKQALGVIADLASVSSPCLRLLEQNGTNLGQIMIDIIKTEMTPDEADEIKYIEQSIMTK